MIHPIVPGNPHIAPSTLLGRDPADEITKHALVISTQMADDYTPPSASLNPAASAALTPDAEDGIPTPRPTLEDIGTAATAMAWAMQGRQGMVRTTLRHLTPPMLWKVAVATTVLRDAAEAMIARGWDAPTEPLPVLPSDVDGYPVGGATR